MPARLLQSPAHHIRHLVSGTSTIFTDQMPSVNVYRKVHSMLASKFATVYHLVSQVSGMKCTVSSTIKKTLGYTFYPVDEFFVFKNDS
jgi:hypothetical protein